MSRAEVQQNCPIHVIGGGLAGSECALQLASLGHRVILHEMRGVKSTPAHKTENLAELVCSNSFGNIGEITAPGQLKWEAKQLGSFVLKAAERSAVPAGQALGVDRELFSQTLTQWIQNHPKIEIQRQCIQSVDQLAGPKVFATGPLTDDSLAADLIQKLGAEHLYFFDAIAPIIDADSINMDIAWKADRYGKGSDDYINCPLNKEQYLKLISEIKTAKKIEPKHFEITPFFEGCMPIEVMVDRGDQTLRFGPMKPVGLDNPRTGRWEYAIVQLRQDNQAGTAFNMVGFQTRMAYSEQVRIFRMIPGLENAEFLKLGSIHRNLFVNSPKLLNQDLSTKFDPFIFLAGQITGVEGYFESTCMGLLVARHMHAKLMGAQVSLPPPQSAMGALLRAITDPFRGEHFQPTNINFGLLPPLENPPQDSRGRVIKSDKKQAQIELARSALMNWLTPQQKFQFSDEKTHINLA